jgi:phage FluMu protein Com
MPNHQCNICSKIFLKKYHLNRHLNRQNKCQTTPQNNVIIPQTTAIPPQNIIPIPIEKEPMQFNNNNNNYQCHHCNKFFARKDNVTRHIKEYCPILKQENEEKQIIFNKLILLESKNKELE